MRTPTFGRWSGGVKNVERGIHSADRQGSGRREVKNLTHRNRGKKGEKSSWRGRGGREKKGGVKYTMKKNVPDAWGAGVGRRGRGVQEVSALGTGKGKQRKRVN